MSNADYLTRLQRFYQYHAPEKVPTAAFALEACVGREDALLRALERKYGPEPIAPIVSSAGHGNVSLDCRGTALAFTTSRSSSPLYDHDSCKGNGAASVGETSQQSPLHFSTTRNRLERIYAYYAPELLESVDLTLEAYAGHEDVLFRVLSAKYGAVPHLFTATVRTSAGTEIRVAQRGLRPHCVYDATAALRAIGFPRDRVHATLAMYGTGRERYAAACALIVTLIGEDALFDTDAGREILFPYHRLRHVTGAAPGALERMAFEHMLAHRRVFLAHATGRAALVDRESDARAGLCRQRDDTVRVPLSSTVVLGEARRVLPGAERELRARLVRAEAEARAAVAQQALTRRGRLLATQRAVERERWRRDEEKGHVRSGLQSPQGRRSSGVIKHKRAVFRSFSEESRGRMGWRPVREKLTPRLSATRRQKQQENKQWDGNRMVCPQDTLSHRSTRHDSQGRVRVHEKEERCGNLSTPSRRVIPRGAFSSVFGIFYD